MPKGDSKIVVELLRVYNNLAEQLNLSAELGRVLHDLKDIKAGGNEIEHSVRKVLQDLLASRYHVGQGHILDKSLSVSKQYDLVITENVDYTSILETKDGTELFYYETVYAIGEVKATWNLDSLTSTSASIEHLKKNLSRTAIDNRTILSGSAEIRVSDPITSLPIRNPLFSFACAIKEEKIHKLSSFLEDRSRWAYLPNIMVVLNQGVFVLVDENSLSGASRKFKIHLYPEYLSHDSHSAWRFISCTDPGKNLAYLQFCLQEHLSNTILERPPFLTYSSCLIDVDDGDLLSLSEI